jgi:site-specific DNA-methyltransferase (cytosine-N4-specific)
MPEEIVNRCVRMFTMVNDIVLDPFAGSGTTLKVAKRLRRNYIGYELYGHYRDIIEEKLQSVRGTARSEDKLRV